MTNRKPPRTKCPCCGATVEALYESGLPRLGANQQALVNIVQSAKGRRIATESICARLWANDPNGGPALPNKTIAVMVRQINAKTMPYKFRIECGAGRRDGYRIVYL